MNISFINHSMPAFRRNNYIPPKSAEEKGFRNLEHLHCAVCGDEMMLKRTQESVTKQLFDENGNVLPASKSISVFRQTIPYLPIEEANVVILMEKYAKKYPNKTFEEIFQLPEVTNPLLKKKEKKEKAYQTKFDKFFKKIEKLLPDLSEVPKEELEIFKARLIYNGYSKKSIEMKKYTTRKIINEFAEKTGIEDKKTIENLLKIGEKLPYQKPDETKLICEYIGKKDTAILQSLLRNHLSTIRHFGAPTDSYTMLCLCERCNIETGNLTLKEMLEQFKNMTENIRKYVIDITNRLLVKDIGVNKDYPDKFQKFFKEETGIYLTIPSAETLKEEQFLEKYPKIKRILAKSEPLSEQRARIHNTELRIRSMKRENAEPAKINEYRFLLKLLSKKLEDSKKNRRC